MKHLKKYSLIKKVNEDIKIDIDTTTIILLTAWLFNYKKNVSNIKSNMKDMKSSFLSYCNSMGYVIDENILDLKFNELVNKVKKTIKL